MPSALSHLNMDLQYQSAVEYRDARRLRGALHGGEPRPALVHHPLEAVGERGACGGRHPLGTAAVHVCFGERILRSFWADSHHNLSLSPVSSQI